MQGSKFYASTARGPSSCDTTRWFDGSSGVVGRKLPVITIRAPLLVKRKGISANLRVYVLVLHTICETFWHTCAEFRIDTCKKQVSPQGDPILNVKAKHFVADAPSATLRTSCFSFSKISVPFAQSYDIHYNESALESCSIHGTKELAHNFWWNTNNK